MEEGRKERRKEGRKLKRDDEGTEVSVNVERERGRGRGGMVVS